jgi:hypothetical protein
MVTERQRLIKIFTGLNQQQKSSLLDFAGYLQQQSLTERSLQEQENLLPLDSPRPKNENVVNAIKRLRASYFMLNADDLLNDSSALMAQFMLQGRPANEVIDDLEKVFQKYYNEYLQS